MSDYLLKSFESSININNKRAIKNDAIGNLTVEDFETALEYFEGKCVYSGEKIDSKEKISIEHVIPITSGGHSMAFNCVPVIRKYNTIKSGYHLLDWWRTYTKNGRESLYNPYRLLKLINYMLKSLEARDMENKRDFILNPNEVDEFLTENKEKLNQKNYIKLSNKAFQKINQLEFLTALELVTLEDNYTLYSSLDGLKLNPAIFFEEAIYLMTGDISEEIIQKLEERIKNISDIYIDNKKVFSNEMDPKDIEIRRKLLNWAKKEGIENEFGIIGYMDFEILKKQENLEDFLNSQKQYVLEIIGANEYDFNNILNKIPNVLTNLNLETRVKNIETNLGITRTKTDRKSSEMYRYLSNKPDLVLSGKLMDILIEYSKKLHIDKRILKKGISLNIIVDNIEACIEILNTAELDINDKVKKRILEKMINNSNGKLIREAYKNFKQRVAEDNRNKGKLHRKEINKSAAKWLICVSEKYNTSEIFDERKIKKTKELYSAMSFDKEGYMVGVNKNAYIVPNIIRLANLNISRETEANIINDVFFIKRIKRGENVEEVYKYLIERVRQDNPSCDEEHILQDAARWFVFLAENPHISLNVMFDERRDKYADITIKYYKDMKFDEEGNFINQEISELNTEENELHIGKEYMNIIDSFFYSKGDYYIIGENRVKKSEVHAILYKGISKCKSKRDVKNLCIQTRKLYKGGKRNNGKNR